jgi:PspA associated protein B
MGFLDALLGRSKPVPPNLDQLFALPSAAINLQAATGYRPTGTGSVCFKAAEGGGFTALRDQVDKLLAIDDGKYTSQTDRYGYTWLVRQTSPDDVAGLVTDLHAVNSELVDAGFGAALLCTLVAFTDGHPLGLVYLYKQGSWYPFVPAGPDRRDNPTELQVRSVLTDDLRIEPDLTRWFPVYGAPGL